MDWYQNNDFLGVALCSVYVPFHIESEEDPCSLECELNFHGHQFEFVYDLPSNFWSMGGSSSKCWPVDDLLFECGYSCCHNGGESNQVWVAYYPKIAIKNEYWSNKWRHLKASFYGPTSQKVKTSLIFITTPVRYVYSLFIYQRLKYLSELLKEISIQL